MGLAKVSLLPVVVSWGGSSPNFSFARFDMENRNVGGRLLEMRSRRGRARILRGPGEDRARTGRGRASTSL